MMHNYKLYLTLFHPTLAYIYYVHNGCNQAHAIQRGDAKRLSP